MNILFIGKFQPPHLGHILTINKLIKKYSVVTIGITEGKPKFFKRKKIKLIFESIYHNEKKVNIVLLNGAVDEKTIKIDKKYKLIISGNKLILKILDKLNFKTKYQPRTRGYGFSGRLLRKVMQK